jgi:hypothetical protein
MYAAHFLPFLKVQILLCSILPTNSIRINRLKGKLESKKFLRYIERVYAARNLFVVCVMLILKNRWGKLDKWEQIVGFTCLVAGFWGTIIRLSFIKDLSKYLVTVNGIIGFETNSLKMGNTTQISSAHFKTQ